ncbi:MAG: ATP-binding cassette domain-containing protein, partial [candidate division NC10 bacterium]
MAFGGVTALGGVSLEVRRGEIFSLIGPNGAGKTVLLNCINGLYTPQQGRVVFEGEEISRLRPSQRARLGIARTFQKIELFKGMTVLDNIRLGRHLHLRTGLLAGLVYAGRAAREEVEHREFIEREIIDFLEIQHIRHKIVG